ncbi:MAG: methyltransferase domain-containing protein [Polyangiaceae bacterium]
MSAGEVEALNDRLATEHPIDDYYVRSAWPIRFIERERLAIIRRMVGAHAGLDLAEIGSGGGHVLRMFPGARLTALDVSGVFLETARRNLRGYDVRFLKGELTSLALPSASFDRVVCTEVLEHTEDPSAILGEIRRILRPSGLAVITVPNDPLILSLKGIVRRTPVGWALRDKVSWGGDEYHLHVWRPRQFEELLGPYFEVTARASAPFDWLPVRACFQCAPR